WALLRVPSYTLVNAGVNPPATPRRVRHRPHRRAAGRAEGPRLPRPGRRRRGRALGARSATEGGAQGLLLHISRLVRVALRRSIALPDGATEPSRVPGEGAPRPDRKSTRLNSSHVSISYAV